jgi:hypothetical protein
MSELTNVCDNRTIRKQLLAASSAMVLTAYIASSGAAGAQESGHPTVWIELGGQLQSVQGTTTPLVAPFMSTPPVNEFYDPPFFAKEQKSARFASGFEGKLTFQPNGSDWIFAAGIRYGRSHASRHKHYQTLGPSAEAGAWNSPYIRHLTTAVPFADITTSYREQHFVVDFTVGRDIGIGAWGQGGSSIVSAGMRMAEVTVGTTATAYARPNEGYADNGKYGLFHLPRPVFTEYTLTGDAQRSFHGVGPSLSWNASATLLGNHEDGELNLDWGINGALLFGKQKAKVDHGTTATFYSKAPPYKGPVYAPRSAHRTRSRSITIPNLGGFAGLSVRYPNVEFSLGYRADFFFGAVDTGIDERQTKALGFYGPFATISIGLGG